MNKGTENTMERIREYGEKAAYEQGQWGRRVERRAVLANPYKDSAFELAWEQGWLDEDNALRNG